MPVFHPHSNPLTPGRGRIKRPFRHARMGTRWKAVMTTRTKSITADELLAMPRGDGKRYELIRGVLIQKMPTGTPHGLTVSNTDFVLNQYCRSTDYGDTVAADPGYLLDRDPDTVRAPDIAWFAPGRLTSVGPGFRNWPLTWRWKSNHPATPIPKWPPRRQCGSATVRNNRGCSTRSALPSRSTAQTPSR